MSEIDDESESIEGNARRGDVETADAPGTRAGAGSASTTGDSPGDGKSPRDGDARDEGDPPVAEATHLSAGDAFAALGNDVRTSVLRSLTEREPRPFSELLSAAPVETSAGFAYHLRQLDGRFVRKDGDGYRLTNAGRRAARAVRAGTYTDRIDFDPVDLADDCPICGEDGLQASCADSDVTVACGRCGRSILTLPLPPGGSDESPEALVESLDRHTRNRLSLASEGNCPECAGAVEAALSSPPDGLVEDLAGERDDDGRREDGQEVEPAQARVACPTCGWRLACPVALAVLDHPAVVSFYHDHGRDVRERPVWNVGEEWRETVLSTDPWCVRVSTRLDDDALSLLVGRDLTVVETERREVGRP